MRCALPTTSTKSNILIVDDEPQIARVLKTTLTGLGYFVRSASDGDEAYHLPTGLRIWWSQI